MGRGGAKEGGRKRGKERGREGGEEGREGSREMRYILFHVYVWLFLLAEGRISRLLERELLLSSITDDIPGEATCMSTQPCTLHHSFLYIGHVLVVLSGKIPGHSSPFLVSLSPLLLSHSSFVFSFLSFHYS